MSIRESSNRKLGDFDFAANTLFPVDSFRANLSGNFDFAALPHAPMQTGLNKQGLAAAMQQDL